MTPSIVRNPKVHFLQISLFPLHLSIPLPLLLVLMVSYIKKKWIKKESAETLILFGVRGRNIIWFKWEEYYLVWVGGILFGVGGRILFGVGERDNIWCEWDVITITLLLCSSPE